MTKADKLLLHSRDVAPDIIRILGLPDQKYTCIQVVLKMNEPVQVTSTALATVPTTTNDSRGA